MKEVHFIIQRQDHPDKEPYEEEFMIPYRPTMNVISALMEIQRNPVNANGEKTTPVAWTAACLEEVCGSCSVTINGTPRQACTALIDKLEQPIRLKPMSSFPIVRDLIIDRTNMFDTLKRSKSWIPIDGTYDLGEGPRMAEPKRQVAYEYSKCMTCGVCLEACPVVNVRSDFIGPFIFSQVELKNAHPTGKMNQSERLQTVMGEGGIEACSNSQNCVQSCPKGIPLTTAIAAVNRKSVLEAFRNFFGETL
ncbi:succinate dehydrogenase subunit B [Halobacillus alkaliphilus]|uniref:succinate dehydrogenase n=1 Tax=Halobacillus alkaliphilus TaxID=396056 RepID=A0A1I2LSB5_9BACI|nr:succinate dehydrogenase iron-sulfur subunit [Halobacillus alkaliphilus]SFF79941.1 succinate dehydrogenase subunit B [Halobacillus alkaliphilus]